MASEITSSNGGVHLNGNSSAKDASKTKSAETTQKALKVFEKDIQKPAQEPQTPVESERDYYISKFMKEDGLNRDVAAAKYDFFA
jgi:hypothetical protein